MTQDLCHELGVGLHTWSGQAGWPRGPMSGPGVPGLLPMGCGTSNKWPRLGPSGSPACRDRRRVLPLGAGTWPLPAGGSYCVLAAWTPGSSERQGSLLAAAPDTLNEESCAVRPRAWNGARFKTGVSAYRRADAPQSPPSRGRSLHTPEAPGSGGDLLSEPMMGEGGVSAGGAFRPGEHAAGRWGCRVQTRPPGTAAGERRAWRGPC